MNKREWLAHRALRAMLHALNDRNNPKTLTVMDDATGELCPVCACAILYCRCFDEADPAMLSTPNKRYRLCPEN